MAKFRVTTPATSANLGPGFDFCGVALDLYNVYDFSKSEEYELVGFGDIKDNLVLSSYKYVFKKLKIEEVKVKIELVRQDIPVARGLGSSSSAIVAGVIAAIHFSNYKETNEENIIKMMVELEGHPDNVLPCYYGGLITTIPTDNSFYINKINCSKDLRFITMIPNYQVKTKKARKVLKKKYKREIVTLNSSRLVLFKDAFTYGDMDLFKLVLVDYVHEPFRKKLIKEYNDLKTLAINNNLPLIISGSGPTTILLCNNDVKALVTKEDVLKELPNLQVEILKVSHGALGEEIE